MLQLRPLGTSCLQSIMLTLYQIGLQFFSINGDTVNILGSVGCSNCCSQLLSSVMTAKAAVNPFIQFIFCISVCRIAPGSQEVQLTKLHKNWQQARIVHRLQFADLCPRYLDKCNMFEFGRPVLIGIRLCEYLQAHCMFTILHIGLQPSGLKIKTFSKFLSNSNIFF